MIARIGRRFMYPKRPLFIICIHLEVTNVSVGHMLVVLGLVVVMGIHTLHTLVCVCVCVAIVYPLLFYLFQI